VLAIAGAPAWRSPYAASLLRVRDPRVRFIGGVYEPGALDALLANAFAYIHGNEVGGTNPALLQAMGAGRCVLAFDVGFNREVLGDAGLYYRDEAGLRRQVEHLLAHPGEAQERGRRARERAARLYRWDAVADDYERLFAGMSVGGRGAR